MKLKYTLTRKGNTIYFQIHEQSVPRGRIATATNGLKIESDSCPQLAHNFIFLRGMCKHKDTQTVSLTLNDISDAELKYKQFKTALEEVFGKPSKWSINFKYGGKSSCK